MIRKKNDIEIYSIHNEEKSIVAEVFIRTLKNKIYNYMISISKNVYIDKLDDVVNKYNNTFHSTDKMEPVDLKSNTLNLVKKLTIKILTSELVILSEYQNVKIYFQKAMFQAGLKKFL